MELCCTDESSADHEIQILTMKYCYFKASYNANCGVYDEKCRRLLMKLPKNLYLNLYKLIYFERVN